MGVFRISATTHRRKIIQTLLCSARQVLSNKNSKGTRRACFAMVVLTTGIVAIQVAYAGSGRDQHVTED